MELDVLYAAILDKTQDIACDLFAFQYMTSPREHVENAVMRSVGILTSKAELSKLIEEFNSGREALGKPFVPSQYVRARKDAMDRLADQHYAALSGLAA